MKSYENDAFINDIDFSPNYKLDLIEQTLKNKKFDVGFYDEMKFTVDKICSWLLLF